jgi:hypothetical protein
MFAFLDLQDRANVLSSHHSMTPLSPVGGGSLVPRSSSIG